MAEDLQGPGRRSSPGRFLADNPFQEPLQDVFKRLIQTEADRLPGRGVTGLRLDLCGQIVATGRSLQAFRAEGGEQTEEVNFPGRAPGELEVFGELEQVGFSEEDGADGKGFGRGFLNILVYNSINTIIMTAKKPWGIKSKFSGWSGERRNPIT